MPIVDTRDLPANAIVVSYSELDAFRQCPHKHFLGYRLHWTPLAASRALDWGQGWHLVMETHYRALQAGATDKARQKAIIKILTEMSLVNEEKAEILVWMYEGYLERYGLDPDWEIIAIEDGELVQLPDRAGRGSRFWLRLRADLIIRESFGPKLKRKFWLVDHKSCSRLPTDRELDIDDQFGLYTWGKRRAGTPIFGSWYSAARTQRNQSPMELDDRFKRVPLYRTDEELEFLARDACVTARTAYSYGPWEGPRAPDTDRCRWRCPFTEPCLMGRKTHGRKGELGYLRAGGFEQITEEEALKRRGYKQGE